MKCPKDLLGLYLDNRLDEKENSLVEEHLGCCSSCQAELAQLKRLFAWLKSEDTPVPGPDFASGIMAAVEKEPIPLEWELQRRQRLGQLLGWGTVLIGLGGLALIIILLWTRIIPALSNGLIWLWGKVVLFSPSLLSEWIVGLETKESVLELIVDSIESNSYLWSAVIASGFFGWMMAREIIDDVQRIIGYKK